MSNLLKAEFYKLFHSWYFWGIGLFNLLLSSVLLLDSVGETSNLFFASIYNMPILYFLTIIFSACLLEMILAEEHYNHISMPDIDAERYYLRSW